MTDEHRPSQDIWLDDEAINDHFESVKDRIKSGANNSGGSDWEDVPAVQNELTRDLKGK